MRLEFAVYLDQGFMIMTAVPGTDQVPVIPSDVAVGDVARLVIVPVVPEHDIGIALLIRCDGGTICLVAGAAGDLFLETPGTRLVGRILDKHADIITAGPG